MPGWSQMLGHASSLLVPGSGAVGLTALGTVRLLRACARVQVQVWVEMGCRNAGEQCVPICAGWDVPLHPSSFILRPSRQSAQRRWPSVTTGRRPETLDDDPNVR